MNCVSKGSQIAKVQLSVEGKKGKFTKMVVLTGKNLGARHQELNYKVSEFVASKKSFDDIKFEEENADIDKLYKIDIASQYKDIDYILEVLKSGDSLYISRALKCLWIYHDNYSHVIDVDNLHVNVFPFMSMKMKKKMLSAMSIHIRDNERAAKNFLYCNTNGMPNIAFKFLNCTSEEFKLTVINDKKIDLYHYIDMDTDLQNFVGNSFVLATKCIEMCEWLKRTVNNNLRYLYAINNDQYLDILEKYEMENLKNLGGLKRLGIRISRNIMLNNKDRVLNNPVLYVNKLNKSMLIKYSSKCEAKQYMSSLMPATEKEFWQIDFCSLYDYILNLIPITERFEFMKQLFTTSYLGQAFENTIDFYTLKYYNMMLIDQRQSWALRNIEAQNEILGDGNDYIWYKFVNIDKALIEIYKYVMVTPDSDKRSRIVNILVEAARDQNDLKKVLDYYYERHINEKEEQKNNFINKVLGVHNVFEFNIDCWQALNKLLCSLDIYSVGRYTDKVFLAVAVISHILHNIDMPEALVNFIDLDVNYSYFSLLLNKLSKEKSEIVFQYLIKVFIDKLQPFEQDPHNKKLRQKLIKYVNNIYNLLSCFQRKDEECPDIVKKFMDIHSPKPKETKTFTAKDIYHFIKTDAKLAVDVLDHTDLNINDKRSILNETFKKLKVYFHNDVAVEFMEFLDRKINKASANYDSYKIIETAVFGIFQLGDENFKANFMEKYHPTDSKIDHSMMDRKLLHIQEAICRFMGYSRPTVPLKNALLYIKGDYVQYCLPIFNMYLANMPLPLLMKFTEGILNTPLSVQKHGLRLAFECFSVENLKTLILSVWNKTKNVSLRKIIYKSLCDKIKKTIADDGNSKKLYEVLKVLTINLNQEDNEELFELIYSCDRFLPTELIDDYLQTAWNMMIKLPKKRLNIDRQIQLVRSIERNIKLVQRDFVRKRIIDEHVNEVIEEKRLRPDDMQVVANLWHAKWKLTANYVVQFSNSEELEHSLTLLSLIFKKCLDMWHDKYENSYVFQKFYFDFISYIKDKNFILWYNNPEESRGVPIFKHIIDMLETAFPIKEIYLIIWNLKLTIYLETSVSVAKTVLSEGDGNLKPLSYEEILSDNIVNQVEIYIKELIGKHQFYPVFLPEIASLLKHKFSNLKDVKNFTVFFCQRLAKIGLKETHLLTLMVLPADVPEEMKEVHVEILKMIQEFESEEVQSYRHFKFLATFNNKFV